MSDVTQSVIAELDSRGMRNSAVGQIALNLAGRIDNSAEDKEVAGIAKELRAILDKVEAMPTQQGDSVDDLSAKRRARRAKAANS